MLRASLSGTSGLLLRLFQVVSIQLTESLLFVPIDDSGPQSFCPVLSFNYHLFRLDGFLDIEQVSSSSPVRMMASVHAVALELALAIGYVCVQQCFTGTNYIWFFIVYKNFKFIKLINNAPGVEKCSAQTFI